MSERVKRLEREPLHEGGSAQLTQEDFLGYDPEMLRCTQCKGMLCTLRAARVYQSAPFIMCSDKNEVKEVLTALYRKSPIEARTAGQPSAL